MTPRETAEEIDQVAADWIAREDRRPLSAEERSELARWLAGDPRRSGAYLRAEAAWLLLDRSRALVDQARPRRRRLQFPRRLAAWSGGAAAAAAAAAALLVILPGGTRIETSVGEIRRVPLQDGSVAAVNTNSDLAVRIGQAERRVSLQQGEAWFRVAKDPDRPFVVAAGDVRVRAVGTAFSVRRRGEGAQVLVTEGVVEAWAEGGSRPPLRLAAGESAFVGRDTVRKAPSAAPALERQLAWRDGKVSLDGETLSTAVAEFNRYNARKLQVSDAALGQERLVGLFDAADPEGFASAAAVALGAEVRTTGHTIEISVAAAD